MCPCLSDEDRRALRARLLWTARTSGGMRVHIFFTCIYSGRSDSWHEGLALEQVT